MKKRWLFILAVLMITATVFVACNSEVADANVSAQPREELVYASFGGSKALTTEYSFIDYTQLYWFYQAEKKDTYGRTGAVTGTSWAKVPGDTNRRGLDGTVGPFSQGLWAFELKGYQTESTTQPTSGDYASVTIGQTTYYYTDLVYSGESTGTGEDKNEVNLKYGNSNAIPVTVAPSGATGKIALGTSTAPLVYSWYQSNGGTGALKLKVTVTPQSATSATDSWDIYYDLNSYQYYGYIYAKNSTTSTDLPTGNYNLVFTVCAVETVDQETVVAYEFAKQALSATVFGSQTTYVKGNLVEGLFVENAHFVATDVASKIVIADSTSVSDFVVDKTPVGTITNGTSVSIPAGELTSGTQNNMTIEVVSVDIAQDIATAVDFVIEDPTEETANIAVAAIDITLKQVTTTTDTTTGDVTVEETSVKKFTQPVTITTYISPNLNSVKVRYNVPADVQEGDDVSQPVAGTGEDKTVADTLANETDTGLGYHPASGLLRFQTTHFSQFFVISDSEAQNVTTGVFYSSFKEALDKATDGQTIKLLKNISVSKNVAANAAVFEIPQNGIVIDGDDHTVSASGSGGYVFYFVEAADYKESWAIKNLTINSTGFQVAVMANAGLGSSLSIDSVDITCDGECVYSNGICYVDGKDCTFTHSGEYAPGKDAVYYSGIIVGYGGSVVLENCSVTAFGNAVCTFPSGGTVELKNCDVSASSSELENAGYVIWARNEDYDYYPEYVRDSSIIIDGGTVSGAIKVTQKYSSRNPHVESKISIKGGTITGSIADYSISGGTHIPSDDSLAKHIIITGGKYSYDPSEFVAPGYVADTGIEEGWWTVRPITEDEAVVMIDRGELDLYFMSLQDAVDEAVDGDTVILLQSVSYTEPVGFNKDITATLDLNEKTLKVTGGAGTYGSGRAIKILKGNLTVRNGVIDGRSYDGDNLNPHSSGTGWTDTRVGGCVRVSGGSATLENLKMYNNDSWGSAIMMESGNGTLVIRDCEISSLYGSSVICGAYGTDTLESGHGVTNIYSSVLIQEGAAVDQYDFNAACVAVQYGGTINIYDSEIQTEAAGTDALNAFSSGGTINVYNGTYTSTRSLIRSYGVDSGYYGHYADEARFNIHGGVFTDSEEGDAVYFSPATDHHKVEITGGTFNFDPSEYVAAGYVAVENTPSEGLWTVSEADVYGEMYDAELGWYNKYYSSFEAAFAELMEAEVENNSFDIHFLKDLKIDLNLASLSVASEDARYCVLCLDGHTLSGSINLIGSSLTLVNGTVSANITMDVLTAGNETAGCQLQLGYYGEPDTTVIVTGSITMNSNTDCNVVIEEGSNSEIITT